MKVIREKELKESSVTLSYLSRTNVFEMMNKNNEGDVFMYIEPEQNSEFVRCLELYCGSLRRFPGKTQVRKLHGAWVEDAKI